MGGVDTLHTAIFHLAAETLRSAPLVEAVSLTAPSSPTHRQLSSDPLLHSSPKLFSGPSTPSSWNQVPPKPANGTKPRCYSSSRCCCSSSASSSSCCCGNISSMQDRLCSEHTCVSVHMHTHTHTHTHTHVIYGQATITLQDPTTDITLSKH